MEKGKEDALIPREWRLDGEEGVGMHARAQCRRTLHMHGMHR
jgi:hypothetical protein